MPDGSIPQRQKDILIAIGTFLKQNGTAIYNTRAWTVYGEGPTKMGGGAFTAPTAGTASDYRYTASKDGDAIYAIILGWPGNGRQINLTAVTPTRFNVGTGKVFLFAPLGGGSAASLAFSQDGSGLHVTLPSAQPYTAIAYAMKISKSGAEPAPTPTIDGSNPDGGAPDGGGMDASQTGTGGAGGSGGRGGSGGAGGTSGTSGAAGAAAGAGGTAGTGGATSGVAGSGAGGFGGTVAAGSAGSAGGTGGTTGAGGVSAGRGGGAAAAATGTGGTGGAGLDNGSAGCTCALATRGATPIGGDVILVFVALAMIASRRQRSVDIARGLVAGEAWAVSATWRRFAPMVRFNAERSLGSRSEADDVVQEVFFRVFRRAKTLRDPSCLRGFILAFTTRVLKRELRRRRGRGRFPLLQGEGAADPPSRASDFESRDLLTRLFALLDRLKPRDRVIFVFRRMESLSLDEIAATMDLSISTVKRSVAHASGRLASWVEADPGLAGLGFRGRTRPDRAMLSRSAPSPRRPRSR
jgi:RNA polymerase sigma factor (sigma-70 family)